MPSTFGKRSGPLRKNYLEDLVAITMLEAAHRALELDLPRELRGKRRRHRGELFHPIVGHAAANDERVIREHEVVIVVGHLFRETELVPQAGRRQHPRELHLEDVRTPP